MENKSDLISSLMAEVESLKWGDEQLDRVRKRANMLVKKVFSNDSEYLAEISKIRFSPMITTSGTTPDTYRKSFESGKRQLINLVKVMIEDIQLDSINDFSNDEKGQGTKKHNNNVFIVHGHSEEMKQYVARTIDKLDLDPIILHDQPSQGRTIIEKFTHFSNVGFAVVLLSADDVAYAKSAGEASARHRARQNVILELGYFLGKLGRERVLALYEDGVDLEIPSDYQGVLFVPYDKSGSWKFSLVKELNAAGYTVDANKIL